MKGRLSPAPETPLRATQRVNYNHKSIQVRRGTSAEWAEFGAKCAPLAGEICAEFHQDLNGSLNGHVSLKIGNGADSWRNLPYLLTDTDHPAFDLTQEDVNNIKDLLFQGDIDGDGNINIPPELIDGLVDALDSKAEQADLDAEVAARVSGDKSLQDQIDALDPDGDRTVDWNEIEGRPSEFPPADHNHDGDYLKTETDPTVPDHVKAITTDDIDNWNAGGSGSGGASTWDELTGKPSEFPPEAHNQDWSTITNTPSEYPPEAHTHEQGDVDGLELRLEAIEDSITSGGGFVDAPDDGKLYGRQSEAWAEVVVPDAADPDWADIQNKPAEFPPESHTHDIGAVNGLQDALDAAGGAPAWDDVTGKPTEFPPESHDHDSVYSKLGHTHPTSDVSGLDAALGEITGDISDLESAVGSLSGQLAFGGSYDAATGLVVKANLGGYEQGQALPDASTVLDTFVIVSIAGSNPEELNEGDWLVAGGSGWVPIKYGTAGTVDWSNIENTPDFDALYAEADHGHEEITKDAAYIKYVIDKWEASPAMSVTGDFDVGGETSLSGDLSVDGDIGATGSISLSGDLSVGGKVEGDLTVNGNIVIDGGGSISNPSGEEFITEAPEDGKQYARQDGAWTEVASDESAGAGMVIQPDEPADPATGLQWLESTTGRVWIWDENKWLEFPASSPQSAPVIVSEDEPADPVIGQLWYKPSEGAMYVYDGSDWQAFGSGDGGNGGNPDGGGGNDGSDLGEAFLIIAGGGGGGAAYAGGGGGAGGYVLQELGPDDIPDGQKLQVSIGAGGLGALPAATNGSDSYIIEANNAGRYWGANAGGAGGTLDQSGGRRGGSGGGSTYRPVKAGGTEPGGKYGPPDTIGHEGAEKGVSGVGDGGGGAGEPGHEGTGQKSGRGGDGLPCTITGEEVYYAGGGAGGNQQNYGGPSEDSLGGGGYDKDGVDGLGGGGGGTNSNSGDGYNGGDGIVIIRTKKTGTVTNGDCDITKDGDYNIYSFTSTGMIQF